MVPPEHPVLLTIGLKSGTTGVPGPTLPLVSWSPMSHPDFCFPCEWWPPLPPRAVKVTAVCCLLFALHGWVSLLDFCFRQVRPPHTPPPPTNKPWIYLSLSAGSFLGLPAQQLQGLQACGVQSNRYLQIKVQIIKMSPFS